MKLYFYHEHKIVDLKIKTLILSTFYEIHNLIQVPVKQMVSLFVADMHSISSFIP